MLGKTAVESTVDKSLPESDPFFDIFQEEALEVSLKHDVLVRNLIYVLVLAQNLYLFRGNSFSTHASLPFLDG